MTTNFAYRADHSCFLPATLTMLITTSPFTCAINRQVEVAGPTLEGLPVSTGAEAGVWLYQDRAIDRRVTAALCPCLTGRSLDHSHKRVSQVKITYSLISSTAYKLYIYNMDRRERDEYGEIRESNSKKMTLHQ